MNASFSAGSEMSAAAVFLNPSPLQSDNTLIERIARGEQLAMRILYCRYSLRVFRTVMRITRDATLAEDILSDVFLDVWRTADQYQSRASVWTWLVAIARHKTISTLRRRRFAELDAHTAQSIVDPADGPDLILEKKDRRQVIGRYLDRLSPSHRTIIDLVYFHDKSVSEVAEIVQVSESTVKTRMFYARRKLAEVLSPV